MALLNQSTAALKHFTFEIEVRRYFHIINFLQQYSIRLDCLIKGKIRLTSAIWLIITANLSCGMCRHWYPCASAGVLSSVQKVTSVHTSSNAAESAGTNYASVSQWETKPCTTIMSKCVALANNLLESDTFICKENTRFNVWVQQYQGYLKCSTTRRVISIWSCFSQSLMTNISQHCSTMSNYWAPHTAISNVKICKTFSSVKNEVLGCLNYCLRQSLLRFTQPRC